MDRPESFKQVINVSGADPILRQSLSDVLRSKARPLTLFTPALLITHGGFDRDPVVEFDARYPAESRDLRPFYTELRRDNENFFRGLGVCALPGGGRPITWDKRLYCIDATRAEECFAFLGGIAFSDPKTGFFASVFSYDAQVPDPTSETLQQLTVKIFGVASNSFVAFLDALPGRPPKAKKLAMQNAAAALSFVRSNNLLTPFSGEDPLDMRD